MRQTLSDICAGALKVEELPAITVLDAGFGTAGEGRMLISLNNRRLWVIKQCKAAGLLETVVCRVMPLGSSRRELKMYGNASRFSLTATLLPGSRGANRTKTADRLSVSPGQACADERRGPGEQPLRMP